MYGSKLGRRVESLQVNQPSREHPHRDQANATDVDANGNTRMREQGKFETPRHKTVINRNGQITPADEWDGGYNVLKDEEELSLVEMDTIQSSMSAPAGNFLYPVITIVGKAGDGLFWVRGRPHFRRTWGWRRFNKTRLATIYYYYDLYRLDFFT